ncbi:unnamed protein product [Paramecium sonneborni]|uniref:Potassium channel domain-containing protein n=1 Tax=Paramecium sonneborni TaxID=65129 RepID=A0A8S1MC02_9CILI|nr:unnamed protein product [Paramecium sonneborni]
MSFDIQQQKKTQENKTTMVNEMMVQNISIQSEMKTVPLIKKQQSKRKFKRATTIIDDDDDIYRGPFEDGRVTRMIFEKCRLIELTRFWFILACLILTILEYEYSFSTFIQNTMEYELNILLYLIFCMSIIIALLTIIAYLIELEYRKCSKIISNKASILQTELKWGLLCEILIIIPTSNPFTRNFNVSFEQRGTGEQRFYTVNEILTYLMFFRLYLLLNIGFKFQEYYSNQIGRVSCLYRTRFGTHLMLKLCIRQFPFYTLTWLFIVGFIQYAYQLEISERPLLRTFETIEYYDFTKHLWVNMITIATVGYGDFFPYTDLGRIAMTLGLFYGVTITSLFTAILYNMLQPNSGEYQSWALLDKTNITKNIKKASSRIFYYLNELRKGKKITKTQVVNLNLEDTLYNLERFLQDVGMLKRMHRDIDGEEFQEMVKRKFGDANSKFKELKQQMQKFSRQQIVIQNILYKLSQNEISAIEQKQEQMNQFSLKYNNEEIISKDDEFFNNLEDSQRDSYLMSFHN